MFSFFLLIFTLYIHMWYTLHTLYALYTLYAHVIYTIFHNVRFPAAFYLIFLGGCFYFRSLFLLLVLVQWHLYKIPTRNHRKQFNFWSLTHQVLNVFTKQTNPVRCYYCILKIAFALIIWQWVISFGNIQRESTFGSLVTTYLKVAFSIFTNGHYHRRLFVLNLYSLID